MRDTSGAFMAIDALEADVVRPSELGEADRTAWHALLESNIELRRAFLSPEYALACERAHGRARVVVFRREGRAVAFFPFQFGSHWHATAGSGESLPMSDQAGLIAPRDFRMTPEALLASAGLNALYVKCLPEEQTAFGLTADQWEAGHVIDLAKGPEEYLKTLTADKPGVVREIERKLRRAQREFGEIDYAFDAAPTLAEAEVILEEKRKQYERTDAFDIFQIPDNRKIIAALFEEQSASCRPVISVLKAGDRILARHFGLLCGDVLSYWFPVYDTEAKGISAGRLLLWHMVAAARRDGVALIDLGEGDVRYKQEFSTFAPRYGTAYWYVRGLASLPARAQRSFVWRYRRMTGRIAASNRPEK